jgi:hypothetical protein
MTQVQRGLNAKPLIFFFLNSPMARTHPKKKKGKKFNAAGPCPDRIIRTRKIGDEPSQLSSTSGTNPVAVSCRGRGEQKRKRVRTIHDNHRVIFFSSCCFALWDAHIAGRERGTRQSAAGLLLLLFEMLLVMEEEEGGKSLLPTVATRAYAE